MKNYKIEEHHMRIVITGEEGIFEHDYKKYSRRTNVYRHFISRTLMTYGTKAIDDIKAYEKENLR